ncbi:MAG: transglutaminase domain-containing protein [Burkholderiaceae bacterium]|nr:transglutaminase domain-containing protein [Burkholderiaceae bacterium]
MQRRQFIATGAAAAVGAGLAGLPVATLAQERRFAPAPGTWRTWEMTARIELAATGPARIWIPLPSLDEPYQRTVGNQWTGNAKRASVVSDGVYGAAMLDAEFDAPDARPVVEVTSVFRTQDRAIDWNRPQRVAELDPASRAFWTASTELKPTDGIVRKTARDIVRGHASDLDKVRAIYRWVVANAHREPTTLGCGIGDIRVMLETGNLSGKCADLNALFVGLARAVGIPARDVYGVRLAPSAWGYRELGGSASGDITKAQHCRAEVHLPQFGGWVAMDPADVLKVMRQESKEWIKDPAHPLAKPVDAGLFGGWEGNWVGYNHANDVVLPGSGSQRLGFVMYPQALNAKGLFDCLKPETFVYTIKARELRSVA